MTASPLPDPPYFAVIFSNQLTGSDPDYVDAANRMETLAKTMPGYLGFESARGEDGFGVSVSYWESEEAIAGWKRQAEHQEAQRRGIDGWYENYVVRVAKVERAYGINKKRTE